MTKGRIKRVTPLVGLAGRTAGEAVVAALRRGVQDRAEFHARTAERYAELLGRSKGVLMKAGQMLSFTTLGDVLPEEFRTIYQGALSRLQANAPPMEPELAIAMVQAELGAPPEDLFDEFSRTPIAAASIGQVHDARLADGRRVAVKIQYPGVEEAIRADLENTELLATFLRMGTAFATGITRVDIKDVAQEISKRIGEEVDYRIEARSQAEFARAYRDHPFIHVPDVIPELSARRVLSMEFADGLPWAQALRADRKDLDRWGEVVFRWAYGSLRRLNMINTDPHPGNYLFQPGGGVTFLDFGSVMRFSPRVTARMRALIQAAVKGHGDELWRQFMELGFLDARDAPGPDEILEWQRVLLRPLTAPQPFTFTREFASEMAEAEFSPFGPFGALTRRVDVPRDFVLWARVDLGLNAVLGELGPTGPWAAIGAEWDDGAPPATRLGELEAEFYANHPA